MTLRTPPNAQKKWERRAAQMRKHIESKAEKIAEGEICAICERDLCEAYDRPIACETCGGDAVLLENDDHIWNGGGIGA